MAQKSNMFVVSFKSNDSIKYAGLDSRDCLTKQENPSSLKKCFSHEQATALVKALRKKGLEEGVTIRVKSLSQSMRDYAWSLIQAVNETEGIDTETMDKVLKRYEVKDKSAKAEASTEEAVETAENEVVL